jgi:hypothetical protein
MAGYTCKRVHRSLDAAHFGQGDRKAIQKEACTAVRFARWPGAPEYHMRRPTGTSGIRTIFWAQSLRTASTASGREILEFNRRTFFWISQASLIPTKFRSVTQQRRNTTEFPARPLHTAVGKAVMPSAPRTNRVRFGTAQGFPLLCFTRQRDTMA